MSSDLDDLLGRVCRGRSRPTAVRMRRLEHQVASAQARLRREAEAEGRVVRGTADWPDYITTFKDQAEDDLVAAVPALLLRRAWRLREFAPPYESHDPRHEVFEILSRRPEDNVPDELQELVDGWMWDLFRPGVRLLERRALALAMLMLGPDGGSRRREQLWSSGLVEQRAADEVCAVLVPGHDLTLGELTAVDWDLINEVVPSVLSGRLPRPDGERVPLTYGEVAAVIADDQWREILGSGQTRPDEDTDSGAEAGGEAAM